MGLTEDERNAIVSLRIANAMQTLEDTKIIVNNKLWKAAANRLYYACYYAANALLVKYGFDAKTHKGTIRLLGLNFISKNIISNELGDVYYKLFSLRQKSDYDDWIIITGSDIMPLLDPAEKFITDIENLINKNS